MQSQTEIETKFDVDDDVVVAPLGTVRGGGAAPPPPDIDLHPE